MLKSRIGLALCLAGRAALASADAPIAVTASIQPIALLVHEVGGERVDVGVLVPPGASPHAFEPRPRDLVQLSHSRLLVVAGAGVDDWVVSLRDAAPGSLPVLSLADAAAEPHAWLDPLTVRDRLAPALARALSEQDPAGAAGYAERLTRTQARMDQLDRELREILATAPGRDYVAYHGAWSAFAHRYGLRRVGVVEEFPGEHPGPRELAALVRAARRARVAAILVEPQLDPRLAAVIAAEFGGGTVLVDPLGDPADPERADYAALMRFNARGFARALGGSPPALGGRPAVE